VVFDRAAGDAGCGVCEPNQVKGASLQLPVPDLLAKVNGVGQVLERGAVIAALQRDLAARRQRAPQLGLLASASAIIADGDEDPLSA
jgi:hypothetical protein